MRQLVLILALAACKGPDDTDPVLDTDDTDVVGDVDADGDGFTTDTDCDDSDRDVNPDAAEVVYDGVDNDCDGSTRDDDLDVDGFGFATDCDDANANVSPADGEVPYDGLDNDCDAGTPDDDVDGDGFVEADDCDDDDAEVNPDADEVTYDGLDNDCDAGTIDDDLDADGFELADDCNDSVAAINPDATEVSYDGLDNDCEAGTPDDDLDGDGYGLADDCDDLDAARSPGAAEVPYDGIDNDCANGDECDADADGYLDDGRVCAGDDCDDSSAVAHPGGVEVTYDGVDNDCDPGTIDDDLDADGFELADDCNDSVTAINPDATEVAYDGLDNDCAGGDQCDVDGDGHDEDGALCLGDDCDDGDDAISPDENEIANDGVDNDCDASTPDMPPTSNFWTFASPWETDDRHDAEIARVYVTHTAWVVVYEDDAGVPGPEMFHTRVSQYSANRILLTNPEDWQAHQLLHLAVYDDQGVTSQFDAADPLLVDNQGNYMQTALDLHFKSSTTDESSAYYAETCTTAQFQENRTDLPVDCRCNEATLFGICGSPVDSYDNGYEFGSGPRLADVNLSGREVGGGFLDTAGREYIVAMNWVDPTYTQSVGTIWAIDVDTGARRVVSGVIDTTSGYQTTGAGYDSNVTVSGVLRHTAPLPYLWDVQPGPDGYWYAYGSDTADNVEITRVDPITGDRELVWHVDVAGQGHTMGQCTSDRVGALSVQFNDKSFAMDPATGEFYLSFHNSSDGDGIARIAADGSTCDVVMRVNSSTRPDVGGGATIQSQDIRGMGWANDMLYIYTVLGDRLYSVDPTTGDRVLVSSVQDGVGTGYGSIGENWLVWDDATGLLWTSGNATDQFVVVDLATGDRQNLLRLSSNDTLYPGGHTVEHEARGPLHPGVWSRERFYWHPDDPDHIALVVDNMGLAIYEIRTSNSYLFSQ